MGKIFPAYAVKSSHEIQILRVDEKRTRAIQVAAEGGFYTAIALFNEAYRAIPRMPETHRSHQDVLYELTRSMDYCFRRETEVMLNDHAHAILEIVQEAESGESYRDKLSTLMNEHTRNIFVAMDLSALLRTSVVMIAYAEGEGISQEMLDDLEKIFGESFPEQANA